MSLLPMLFSDWWEDLDRPHRLADQHFGISLSPEDLCPSVRNNGDLIIRPFHHRHHSHRYSPYNRSLLRKPAGASTVQAGKDKFEVTLDVQQFEPDEISVKVVDKCVVVEGKHEEKRDEHGWISRQFARKYLVPEQCDIEGVSSSLSSDGVLTISAPRKEPPPREKKERVIEIQRTGQPALRNDVNASPGKALGENQKDQTQKSPAQQRGQEKSVKAA